MNDDFVGRNAALRITDASVMESLSNGAMNIHALLSDLIGGPYCKKDVIRLHEVLYGLIALGQVSQEYAVFRIVVNASL